MVSGYVDGTLVSTQAVVNNGFTKPYDLTDYLIIGGRPDIAVHGSPLPSTTDSAVEFQGVIDQVRIYNRPLSSNDVRRLHHYGL